MHTTALKLMEIHKELSLLPDEKIDEVKDYIEFIWYRHQAEKKPSIKLKGIWSGKGFEKIDNLENELKSIQKELSKSILNKDI